MPPSTFQPDHLIDEIRMFDQFGAKTQESRFMLECGVSIPVFSNEFWTARQRAAHSLHEVSYRACFKPQLPRFFIERLTRLNDWVFDPFMGRGTTLVESALAGRMAGGCDVNPLSLNLVEARFCPPTLQELSNRLAELDLTPKQEMDANEPLLVFFHPTTLAEIKALRSYFLEKETLDNVDRWIRMVTTNRLTGHSRGFLSVYTMPPNQAVSIESQRKINEKRQQIPEYRSLTECVRKKSLSLLKDVTKQELRKLRRAGSVAEFVLSTSADLHIVQDQKYQLVVTSPPFLDVINYQQDNWLRCWFNGINADEVSIWQFRKLEDWKEAMRLTLNELRRILRPGGWIAFEVGEVRKGTVELDKVIANLAVGCGLEAVGIMINVQDFTKTSACWGVENLKKGTNSNRIVLMRNPETPQLNLLL